MKLHYLKRKFGTVLRGLAYIIGCLAMVCILIAGLYAAFLLFPNTFINNHTLNFTSYLAGKGGVNLSWSKVDTAVDSQSLTKKTFHFVFEDFCFAFDEQRACFPNIDATVGLNLNLRDPLLNQLGPITALNGTIALYIEPSEEEKQSEPFDLNKWLEQLKALQFEPIRISLADLSVAVGAQERGGALSLQIEREDKLSGTTSDQPIDQWLLIFEGKRLRGSPVRSFSLDTGIAGLTSKNFSDLNASGTFKADLASSGYGKARFYVNSEGHAHNFRLNGDYSYLQTTLNLTTSASYQDDHLKGRLTFNSKNLAPGLQQVALRPCQYDLNFQDIETQPVSNQSDNSSTRYGLTLNCDTYLTRSTLPNEASYKAVIPKSFLIKTNLQAFLERIDDKDQFSANLDAAMAKIKTDNVTYTGTAQAALSGYLGQTFEEMTSDINLDVRSVIPQFSTLVKNLQYTKWAIPAPFNVLDGMVQCGVQGEFESKDDIIRLPLQCFTDLASQNQALRTEAKGALNIPVFSQKKPMQLNGRFVLSDVLLQLPQTRVGSEIPTLIKDGRITLDTENQSPDKDSDSNFEYHIEVMTAHPRALNIASSYSDTPVPIKIDLDVSSSNGTQGQIAITDYEVELFRRQALIDHFQLTFSPDSQSPKLDGLVKVDAVDYDVELIIVGTTAKPMTKIYSEPPMAESDLLGLLIFGRRPSELGLDEQTSVESTRAAVADGAIGLLSMYYLAATPIESIGYNPHTNKFTAKVALSDDVSLTVGADTAGQREVGLRRRISRNWSIQTTAVRQEEAGTTRGVAMFTWSNRY